MSIETEWWDEWNTKCRTGKLDWNEGKVIETLVRTLAALPLPKNQRVLEVGCGTGWLAAALPKHWEYTGYDLSPSAIEAARQRVPGSEFHACDFLEVELEGGQFDGFLSIDTLPHFRDQDYALAKIARTLRPGGWALISTVNPFVYSRLSWVRPAPEGTFRHWLPKRELSQLFKRHGLIPKKSWTILPGGDMGILRFINSDRLNRCAAAIVGKGAIRIIKEAAGLGQFRIMLAFKGDGRKRLSLTSIASGIGMTNLWTELPILTRGI